MNFKDRAIVIHKACLRENLHLVTLFSEHHGLCTGVTKRATRESNTTVLQGNLVDFQWQARLPNHLGTLRCELVKSYHSFLLFSRLKLYAFHSAVSMIRIAFREMDPHPQFFNSLCCFLEQIKFEFNTVSYINLELALLSETGHHIDMSQCADTGCRNDLKYISPKSGRAISGASGKPYADKLLPLPQFLINERAATPVKQELHEAFNICSYFLGRYIYSNEKMPISRANFIDCVLQNAEIGNAEY